MLHFATYYHIYNHANGDDNLFREEKNYDFFLKKYHRHIDPIADTVAWCLMKTHFHLLVKIKDGETLRLINRPGFENLDGLDEKSASNLLSRQFSNFFNSYTKAFNKVYLRRGSLFIKNFKRKEIRTAEYLSSCILYIHLNPVKHGFVCDLNHWTHSSFLNFPGKQPKLLNRIFGNPNENLEAHRTRQVLFEDYQELENNLT